MSIFQSHHLIPVFTTGRRKNGNLKLFLKKEGKKLHKKIPREEEEKDLKTFIAVEEMNVKLVVRSFTLIP